MQGFGEGLAVIPFMGLLESIAIAKAFGKCNLATPVSKPWDNNNVSEKLVSRPTPLSSSPQDESYWFRSPYRAFYAPYDEMLELALFL